MTFRLVYGDYDLALPLTFDPVTEDRILSRMRLAEDQALAKTELAKRIVDAITQSFDGNPIPPSERQTKYALAICKELGIELPADCIQVADSMRTFISKYAPEYSRRKGYRSQA